MFEDKKHVQIVTKTWSDPRIIACHQTAMTMKGDMAWELIKRFGIIAGDPSGEDSTGRAVIRPMDTTEVVARACAIAETAWNEFEKRGWLQALPTPPDEEKCTCPVLDGVQVTGSACPEHGLTAGKL